MVLPKKNDSFLIHPGSQPIVVAAPHHGTLRFVDSDLFTGPIALALAERLKGRAVIVSDLRRTVDVNKNPTLMNQRVRPLALRYQNEVFRELPRLIIEVHGQTSGTYPVEVSSGFDLDHNYAGDAVFLEHLNNLKLMLSKQLGKVGLPSEVGVYPLDRDVRSPATNTYTFQKIRRARNRVGFEWYGLHIELAAGLRKGQRSKAAGNFEELANALAIAIQSSFFPLPSGEATIPDHADLSEGNLSSLKPFKVIKDTENGTGKNMVTVHPQEISDLGYLEGDLLVLVNHVDTLKIPFRVSSNVPIGKIAIPARIRNQMGLDPGNKINVLQFDRSLKEKVITRNGTYIIGEIKTSRENQAWICTKALAQLKAENATNREFMIKGPLPSSRTVEIQLEPSETPMEHFITISDMLMNQLDLSIGDTVTIEARI